MSGDAHITFTGNLTGAPELRFTPSGAAVADFTVAVAGRVKKGEGWEDGPASFHRVTVWREMAENCAESLDKGTRVTVDGTVRQRSYETDAGEKRYVWDVLADEVAVSLRFARASVRKPAREHQVAGEPGRKTADAAAPPEDDPWAAAPAEGEPELVGGK